MLLFRLFLRWGVLYAFAFVGVLQALPSDETVRVIGLSDAALPNREDAAKQDAMRKAVEQVAGTQIDSRSLSSYNQLVGTYTYSRLNGFVSGVEPLGAGEVTAGIFRQRFQITVRNGDINLDIVKQGFDVRFLYDVVQRPRLAIYLSDLVDGDRAAMEEAYARETENRLISFFKSKDTSLVIKDLSFLRRSLDQQIDPVREARNNNFDLLLTGETTWRSKKKETPKRDVTSWGATRNDVVSNPDEDYEVNTHVKWRAVDAATSETVFSFNRTFSQTVTQKTNEDFEFSYAESRASILDQLMPEFFVELLQFWNSRAFEDVYSVRFLAGSSDVGAVSHRLRQLSSLDPSSVILESVDDKGMYFSVKSTLPRPELVDQLSGEFAGSYTLKTIRPGRIEFMAVTASGISITVRVENVRLTEARKFEQMLAEIPEVTSVTRNAYSGGMVEFSVVTRLSSEDLGIYLEENSSELQVVDLNPRNVRAVLVGDE